jgi:hypothetical protein
MLQEENEAILDKVCDPSRKIKILVRLVLWFLTFIPELSVQLRSAEEKREEAEARARELEKQVSHII